MLQIEQQTVLFSFRNLYNRFYKDSFLIGTWFRFEEKSVDYSGGNLKPIGLFMRRQPQPESLS